MKVIVKKLLKVKPLKYKDKNNTFCTTLYLLQYGQLREFSAADIHYTTCYEPDF